MKVVLSFKAREEMVDVFVWPSSHESPVAQWKKKETLFIYAT